MTSESRPTTREDRLKAALRDNLRRRKLQARGRVGPPPETEPGTATVDEAETARERVTDA